MLAGYEPPLYGMHRDTLKFGGGISGRILIQKLREKIQQAGIDYSTALIMQRAYMKIVIAWAIECVGHNIDKC